MGRRGTLPHTLKSVVSATPAPHDDYEEMLSPGKFNEVSRETVVRILDEIERGML